MTGLAIVFEVGIVSVLIYTTHARIPLEVVVTITTTDLQYMWIHTCSVENEHITYRAIKTHTNFVALCHKFPIKLLGKANHRFHSETSKRSVSRTTTKNEEKIVAVDEKQRNITTQNGGEEIG